PPIDPLPSATPSPVVADLPDAPLEEVGTEIEIIQHVVVPGDTLVCIAEEYGAVLQDVLAANSFTLDTIILEGQTILVPLGPATRIVWHTVQAGETLVTIAEDYRVTSEIIQAANNLPDPNAIYSGQRLRIPGGCVDCDQVTEAPSDAGNAPTVLNFFDDGGPYPLKSDWPRSKIETELAESYPLSFEHSRFTLHYQPRTYAETNIDSVVDLLASSLEQVESKLNVELQGSFDVYVAGTLFEEPNANLRGLSRSLDRRLYLLIDGSGNPAENAYLVQHELTHLVSWNTWGSPSSTMISEGLAVWVGQQVLEENGFMPYRDLCAGVYAAGQMSSMAVIERDWQQFEGHIRDRFNYFGSGCFAGYLIDTYGLAAMSQLYNSADYPGLYNGLSLAALDNDWKVAMEADLADLQVNTDTLLDYTEQVERAYLLVFSNYNGSDEMHNAYAAVDRARIALWQADYVEVERWLGITYELMGLD
ncbi:MAG: LysM peptidoglycan-binding domain-containing protein, partial [Chloroflexi bacterium]|nr:LysM peptidoglycan-binding domain-containing protein [Chloroflexota bacterium]